MNEANLTFRRQSLPAHAGPVTVRCEAAGTMKPGRFGRADAVRHGIICEHQCGCGARLGGTINESELLINAVRANKPKVLTGLNQKVRGWMPPWELGAHGRQATGEEAGSNPSELAKRNTVSPYRRPIMGRPTARKAVGGAGRGCRKKRMPGCNGSDRGCGLPTSSRPKGSRLPTGLSSRENRQNPHRRTGKWRLQQ